MGLGDMRSRRLIAQPVEQPSLYMAILTSGWDYEMHQDRDHLYVTRETPIVTFYPAHLSCRACGLKLDDMDELDAANLEPWELSNIDEADFADTADLYDQ
jgi:hypothetical protein